jgi:hypothetical protein
MTADDIIAYQADLNARGERLAADSDLGKLLRNASRRDAGAAQKDAAS